LRVGDQDLIEASKRFVHRARQVIRLRDNLYILPGLGYWVAMLVYFGMYGKLLQFLPILFFLSAVPVLMVLGSSRDLARYWVPFISILLSYEALQGVVGSFVSSRVIFSLYPIDRFLWGYNVTGWVQATFSSHLMTQVTSFFYTLHFPLVVVTSATLWYFNRGIFGKYMTTMVMTSYAALITFVLFPTAPPWYQGVAADLYQSTGGSVLPNALSYAISLIESDKFAAFPSLHTAYAVIFAYFMIKLDRRLAYIALPITGAILFSTIYLGQHYLIDLIGGAIYALIPCLIAERLHIRISGGGRKTLPSSAVATGQSSEVAPLRSVTLGEDTPRAVPSSCPPSPDGTPLPVRPAPPTGPS
jgi:membrane-associated phospholipid phosphatase